MSKHQVLAYAAMGAAMVTVGSTLAASKLMSGAPIFAVMLVRFTVASVLLAALLWLLRKPWPRLSLRSWGLLVIQALIGSIGYSALLLFGLDMTSAADASVVAGTLPAMTALLAVAVLQERLTPARWTAVVMATAAMWLLQTGGATGGSGAWRQAAGNALVLGAVVCEAVFLLLHKRLQEPVDPLWTAALMSVFSLLLCLPAATVQHFEGPLAVLTTPALLAAVYYGVVPTTLGFWLWYAGASRVSGAEAGLFTTLLPVSGLAFAAVTLGEVIETRHWLGGGLAVLAILVGLHAPRRVAEAAD